MSKPVIADVLAQRYASTAMIQLWSGEGRIVLERELWIAVMKAQRELGLEIPAEAITAYEQVKTQVDLARIDRRERLLRHDVKARIEEFCELAGHQHLHKGMTSRDLTDNVEQLQILRSLELVRVKYIGCLQRLANWSQKHRLTMIVARTHNVPAQPTTLGKRLAMFGQEMLIALQALDDAIARYPLRGLQGAVGTQLDQWNLFQQNPGAVGVLSQKVREHLGFAKALNAVGQVYPRSLDYEIGSVLYGLSSGFSSFAQTLRLMAGQELATEGFQAGQVGSSAMPHKMNTRNCERLNGFHTILNGYLNMLMGLSGDQWNEGDVSCSVVRRVALPGIMYAIDGAIETFATILEEMGFYEAKIAQELEFHLPFLATTTMMMAAVTKGCGRETAHEVIKKHSVAVVEALRQGQMRVNDLPERLAADERLPLTLSEIQVILRDPQNFVASAAEQVDHFVTEVQQWGERYPQASSYRPEPVI